MNYVTDAIFQPVVTATVEVALWFALFAGLEGGTLAGYGRDNYLAYAIWASFVSRIAISWMYEYKMIEDIANGGVNSSLARPMSFYEYYFSQLMGYKVMTTAVSFLVPVSVILFFGLDTNWSRLPMALLLVFFYLVLIHAMSFCVANTAFFLTKVDSFTASKNIMLMLFTGEYFPLDLLPSPWKEWFIALPFSSAVYVPVGYVLGRVGFDGILRGFASVTVGIAVFSIVGAVMWRAGLKRYTGTGA